MKTETSRWEKASRLRLVTQSGWALWASDPPSHRVHAQKGSTLFSALLLHLKIRHNFLTRTPPLSVCIAPHKVRTWSCMELITDWGRTPQIPGPVLLPSGRSHPTWGPRHSSPTQTCGINFVPQEPIHPSVHSSAHPSVHPSIHPTVHLPRAGCEPISLHCPTWMHWNHSLHSALHRRSLTLLKEWANRQAG